MARKKKKDDEIRTDGWMDTFADTMTLLLTFFILLYSISAVDSEKLKKLSEALQYSLTGDSSIEEVQSIDDLKVELEKGTKYEDLAAKLNEIIEKNSTNGFFAMDIADYAYLDNFIVVGCCTDICVYQFVLALKTYFNQNNLD